MSRAVGIDKNRDSTDSEECRRCVETCIGNGRNPRTRFHPYRTQGKFQGIRAVRDAHAGSNAAIFRELHLEGLAFASKNVPATIKDPFQCRSQKLSGGGEMALHVVDRNLHDYPYPIRVVLFAHCVLSLNRLAYRAHWGYEVDGQEQRPDHTKPRKPTVTGWPCDAGPHSMQCLRDVRSMWCAMALDFV